MKKLPLLLALGLTFAVSCGDDDDDNGYNPNPPPTDNRDQEREQAFNANIKPLVTQSCAGANCHTSGAARDNVIKTGKNFVSGGALNRLSNESMPPPGSGPAEAFSAADRQKLIDFINKWR